MANKISQWKWALWNQTKRWQCCYSRAITLCNQHFLHNDTLKQIIVCYQFNMLNNDDSLRLTLYAIIWASSQSELKAHIHNCKPVSLYLSKTLRYLYLVEYFSISATSTPLHFEGKYCTFYSNTCTCCTFSNCFDNQIKTNRKMQKNCLNYSTQNM